MAIGWPAGWQSLLLSTTILNDKTLHLVARRYYVDTSWQFLLLSTTILNDKMLHLVARRYYMVPTQGGVSFPLECGYLTVCYY